jgi:hypothetical protein
MLENPFFNVDSVTYITEQKSREIASVRYIIAEKNLINWKIEDKADKLTREYVAGIITGSLSTELTNPQRKAVYRVPRSSYVNDRIKNREALCEIYADDETDLEEIPDVPLPADYLADREDVCELIHISGLPTKERTVFAFLIAQYLALHGKTIIIEKDKDYHTLSDYVVKSGLEHTNIDIDVLLSEPFETLDKIRRSEQNLICITAFARAEYSYPFVCNLLYNNLTDSVQSIVIEDDLNEISASKSGICIIPTNAPQIIKTCEKLPSDSVKFVGVNLNYLAETQILNSCSLQIILSDLLEKRIAETPIVTVTSLRLGGEYDLRSILQTVS